MDCVSDRAHTSLSSARVIHRRCEIPQLLARCCLHATLVKDELVLRVELAADQFACFHDNSLKTKINFVRFFPRHVLFFADFLDFRKNVYIRLARVGVLRTDVVDKQRLEQQELFVLFIC